MFFNLQHVFIKKGPIAIIFFTYQSFAMHFKTFFFLLISILFMTKSWAKKRVVETNSDDMYSEMTIEPKRNVYRNHFIDKHTPPRIPTSISFAGENTPLHRWDVKERLDRELLINVYMHGSTFYRLKQVRKTFPTIQRILQENGVSDDFKYLCAAESALYNQVSKAGAVGYWQFMKSAGLQFGLEINDEVDMRYDLEASTIAACQYLKQAYNKFGSWTAAAASYNMGMAGYGNYSAQQFETDYYNLLLPEETNRYIYRILALKLIISQPDKYGFLLEKEDVYMPIEGEKSSLLPLSLT